jgi:ribulose kinase
MDTFFVGVDVGTGSARAGIFDRTDRMLGSASHDIEIRHPQPDHVEQSSDNICSSVCHAVTKNLP